MFESDGNAADRYLGVGAVVNSVQGVFDGDAFAAMSFAPTAHGGLQLGLEGSAAGTGEGAGTDSREPPSVQPRMNSRKWYTEKYWPFCTPTELSACTANRHVGVLGQLDLPAAVRLEFYHRFANDTAGTDAYRRAGDLLGYVKRSSATDNVMLRVRSLQENTAVAAVYASNHLAQLEQGHGERPRLDATYKLPPNMSAQAAVEFALQDAVGLLRRGLVTTPLLPVLRYMSSTMCSLFAQHYGALRAVQAEGASQMQSLAAYLCLGQTAACLRNLSSGRLPGHGVPGAVLSAALGIPPAGALAPLPALVAQALGMADTAAVGHRTLMGAHSFDRDVIDASAAIAARSVDAYARTHEVKFRCAYVYEGDGRVCEAYFPSCEALHAHLQEAAHHHDPPPGGYAAQAVSGAELVQRELRPLHDDQRLPILATIESGRHILVAGPAGTGKSVLGKALVSCLRLLNGPDSVLYLHPTTMSAHATGDAAATTMHAAAGFGVSANYDPIKELVRKSLANSRACGRIKSALTIVIDEFGRAPHREMSALLDIAQQVNPDKGVDGRAGRVQIVCLGDVGQTLDWTTHTYTGLAKEEAPKDMWLLAPLGKQLDFLAFELTNVRRQVDIPFVRHLALVREGQRWAPGEPAYDFFRDHCSPDLPHNQDLIWKDSNGIERVSLLAVERGYITLVATAAQATEANNLLRDEAKAKATRLRQPWQELHITAKDGKRRVLTGAISSVKDAPLGEPDGSGAPAQATFYVGQAVAVAKGTKATSTSGADVVLPSSLLGTVTKIEGSSLDDVVVTVHFPKSDVGPQVVAEFRAEQVDEPEEIDGFVDTRRMVQLRDGRFMTYHRAQSLGMDLLILDLINGGLWCAAIIYTGLSRARRLRGMIIINQQHGTVRANRRELAYVAQLVERTRHFLDARVLANGSVLVVRDVASFLATKLRCCDDAATLALQAVGTRTMARAAVLTEIGMACLRTAGVKRRRPARAAESTDDDDTYSGSDSETTGSGDEGSSDDPEG